MCLLRSKTFRISSYFIFFSETVNIMVQHLPTIVSMTKNNVEAHLDVLNQLKPSCPLSSSSTTLKTNAEVRQWMSDQEWFKESSQKNLQCAVQWLFNKVKRLSDPDQHPEMLLQSLTDYLIPETPINYNPMTNFWSSVEGAAIITGYKSDLTSNDVVKPFSLLKLERGDAQTDEALLHEIVVGLILNKLRSYLPCFMYLYGGFYCSIPSDAEMQVGNFSQLCSSSNINEMHTCMIAEAVVTTSGQRNFVQLLNNPAISAEEKTKTFIILLLALAEANKRFGFIHGDLHAENILIRTLPSPITLNCQVLNTNISISTQYIPIVIDFGRSYIEWEKYKLKPILYNANNDSAKEFGDLDYFCDAERSINGDNCLSENLIAKGRKITGYDMFRLAFDLNDRNLINMMLPEMVQILNVCLQPTVLKKRPLNPSDPWSGKIRGNNFNSSHFANYSYFKSPMCSGGIITSIFQIPRFLSFLNIIP